MGDSEGKSGAWAGTGRSARLGRAWVGALLAGAFCAALVAHAHALPDVGEEQGGIADTPHSPKAKDPPSTVSFTQVAGAQWKKGVSEPGDDALVEGSPTSVDVDFHVVAARDEDRAFAAGSVEVDGERRPTIYRFTTLDGWQPDQDFPGQGYIAALTWLDEDRALAVGGDGTYPERERDDGTSVCNPAGTPPAGDQAGAARAFLYKEGGGWRELSQLPDGEAGDELPDSTSALSAAGAYLPPPAKPGDPPVPAFAIVGGLCQLWHFSGDGFAREAGQWQAPNRMASGQAKPRFRIRDVSFAEPSADFAAPLAPTARRPRAYAVTSGCCLDSEADPVGALNGAPETLTYTIPTGSAPSAGTWTKQTAASEPRLTRPDTHVSVTATQTGLRANGQPAINQGASSFPNTTDGPPGIVSSPGGPYDENEPASHVTGRSVGALSSVRLSGGDGDVGGGRPGGVRGISQTEAQPTDLWENGLATGGWTNGPNFFGPKLIVEAGGFAPRGADGVPDWSVGELTAGGRAVAYGTDPGQLPPPRNVVDPLIADRCKTGDTGFDVLPSSPDCTANSALTPASRTIEGDPPTGAERIGPALSSSRLVALPSYGLSAIDVLDAEGTGWAVGRHGAIVKFARNPGEIEKRRVQPTSAKADPEALPERGPWAALRPPGAGAPGLVPPLSERPPIQLERPELVPAAGPVPTVVSTDGRYGWSLRQRTIHADPAVAPGERRYVWDAVAYLEQGVWHPCDDRMPGEPPAHPACESYEALKRDGIELNGWVRPVVVPMRTDEDPTNDEEFELVALTNSAETPLARFSEGRWVAEDPGALGDLAGEDLSSHSSHGQTPNHQIAFTASDDALVIAGISNARIFHFDGRRWSDCTSACNPDGLLDPRIGVGFTDSFSDTRYINLTVAGDLMFAYGRDFWRSNVPYILVRRRGSLAFDLSLPGTYYPSPAPPLVEGTDLRSDDGKGWVKALAIAQAADGSVRGLALGDFQRGGFPGASGALGSAANITGRPDRTTLNVLRLGSDGTWEDVRSQDALAEDQNATTPPPFESAVVTRGSEPASFLALSHTISYPGGGPSPQPSRIYRFDEARERWVIEATNAGTQLSAGPEGGFYAESGADGGHYLLHYTDHPPAPVFDEVPRPARPPAARYSRIVQLAAAADGTVWAATDSEQLFRYERAAGWDRVRVRGWDPGRIVTSPSPAHALALSPSGSGLVVGAGGRIAQIQPETVRLDPATGTPCDPRAPLPPCGTTNNLRVVAVAPDGAAVVAGEDRALLWRPAGGELRAILTPAVPSSTEFSSVAIADEDTVWVAAEGRLYRGERNGGTWHWTLENEDAEGELMAIERLALDAEGHGFAIEGERILERVPGAQPLWRRVRNSNATQDALTSIALPAGEGPGALIGGDQGLILTWTPRGFEVARPAQSPVRGPHNGAVIGVALSPGVEPGQVEAWAITGTSPGGFGGGLPAGADPFAARADTGRLLHFASDPAEPLLDPERGVVSLPDAPAPRPGEISFAAFGKSDCQVSGSEICTDMGGGEEYAEQVVSATMDELERRTQRGELDFALWSGDAVDEGSYPGHQAAEPAIGRSTASLPGALTGGMGLRKLRRWGELVPDRLADRGLPTFGTLGAQDLSGIVECQYSGVAGIPEWESCKHRKEVRAGENLGWRHAMAEREAPWGEPGEIESNGFLFESVSDGDMSMTLEDQPVEVDVPYSGKTSARLAAGGAPTHYAIDVYDTEDEEGSAAARLIFADTSQGSLAASDPYQQPIEPDGQAAWLERVLCFSPNRTTTTGERCTREPGQRAIVVTNTPTYSYGPGALRETQPDLGVAFESILMRYDVDVVVSGRIGWNGRYWATAPGIHEPCPGEGYPEKAPEPGVVRACGQGAPGGEFEQAPDPQAVVSEAGRLSNTGGELNAPLPFVVASGAGGKFAGGQGAEQGNTSEGFWHGYTVVRLDPEGDPAKMIVEQRPVYDWVGIEAPDRTLTARQGLTLRGFGRGPVGYNERGSGFSAVALARYDRIDSAAVTHRYDLLAADPQRPWVPKPGSEGCTPYACLPENVGSIDRTTGEVHAGNGKYPDTFAIATLSVGEEVATYPLLFRRSPSFVVNPIGISAPVPAAPIASPNPPQPPSPPNPPAPNVPQPGAPQIPAPLGVPPIAASQPPEPQPPAPPAPPPPVEQLSPLNLALAPPGLTIATPTAVIQPPTPPVNPAPPGGARREARQRQAAAQKSGADNDEAREQGVDMVDGPKAPEGAAFARRERTRPEPSFTAVARADQPSAWAQGLLYTGGLTMLAAALALGWSRGRPTPRRRSPKVPAPARAYVRRR